MSVITSGPEQISKNCTNDSPTKQMFSFPKTARFKPRIPVNTQLCYPPKSQFQSYKEISSSRKSTFGTSDRQDLWLTNEDFLKMAGHAYNLPSNFTPRNVGGKGPMLQDENQINAGAVFASPGTPKSRSSSARKSSYSRQHKNGTFGAGRQSFDKVVSQLGWNYQPHDRKIPGPGTYKHRGYASDHTKYSLRDRTVKNLFTITENPGPGQYDQPITIQSNSTQRISKFNRSLSPSIKAQQVTFPTKHDRVPFHKDRPDPASYSANTFNDMHKVLVRKFSRIGSGGAVKQFGTDGRASYFDPSSLTPGPGTYVNPSDFGHYQSKHAPQVQQRMNNVVHRTGSEFNVTGAVSPLSQRGGASISISSDKRRKQVDAIQQSYRIKNLSSAASKGANPRIKLRQNNGSVREVSRRPSEPYVNESLKANYRDVKPRSQTKMCMLPNVKAGGAIQHVVAMNYGAGKRRQGFGKGIVGSDRAQRYSSLGHSGF